MPNNQPVAEPRPTRGGLVLFAWLVVSIPLLWGVWETLQKAAALFR